MLDFLRDLRAESGAAVAYVHHTPHEGARQRGSSDLEAYWESKLTIVKQDGTRTLRAEHREAEAAGPFTLSFDFDATTDTLRLRAPTTSSRSRSATSSSSTRRLGERGRRRVPGNRKRYSTSSGSCAKVVPNRWNHPEPPPPGQTWVVVPPGGL